MQAARDEMERRIETLKRHAEHCESERDQLLTQVDEYNKQIEQDKIMAADYQEVLLLLAGRMTPPGADPRMSVSTIPIPRLPDPGDHGRH